MQEVVSRFHPKDDVSLGSLLCRFLTPPLIAGSVSPRHFPTSEIDMQKIPLELLEKKSLAGQFQHYSVEQLSSIDLQLG